MNDGVLKFVGEVGGIRLGTIPETGKTIQYLVRGRVADGSVQNVVAVLSLDQSVELARLVIKNAAANGWGSDEERERLIAWAPVNRKA